MSRGAGWGPKNSLMGGGCRDFKKNSPIDVGIEHLRACTSLEHLATAQGAAATMPPPAAAAVAAALSPFDALAPLRQLGRAQLLAMSKAELADAFLQMLAICDQVAARCHPKPGVPRATYEQCAPSPSPTRETYCTS